MCLLLLYGVTPIASSAAAADAPSVQAAAPADQLRALELKDNSGRKHVPFAKDSTQVAVLVFVSVDCPVANAFQPALRQIEQEYSRQGVKFFQVHSSAQAKPDEVLQHAADFQIHTPVVLDRNQATARLVAARVTPEAVVIDRSGQIRYRGLINNLYAGYGKKRRRATAHFLTDALDAVLAGTDVRTPVTKPIGCFIHFEESGETP